MSLRQIRVEFQCATAMKLRLFQPFARRVELIVTSRTGKRKCRMRKRETGIPGHCIRQVLYGFVQPRTLPGRAKPVAPHELCVREVILAIAWPLPGARLQRSV